MVKRMAVLFSDGSYGVDKAGVDIHQARLRLLGSSDDEDSELVEVDIRITQTYGKPKLVEDKPSGFAKCPCCGEEFES